MRNARENGAGRVRQPAVAGRFYPEEPEQLRAMVRGFLDRAPALDVAPKAIIAPHAGYIYSGPIAASAYVCLGTLKERIQRVVLLGPAHRVALRGLAVPGGSAFSTPLGEVPVDEDAVRQILALPQVKTLDAAHDWEHSLEVQLPFLQEGLSPFDLVPLVAGDARPDEVAEVLDQLWSGDDTLVVVSSDLSHYQDYESAQRLDRAASRAIESLDERMLRTEQACGRVPIQGLLQLARERGLEAREVDLRSSGDTAGPRDQVVGYGAYVFC